MTRSEILALPTQANSRLLQASDTGVFYAIEAGKSGASAVVVATNPTPVLLVGSGQSNMVSGTSATITLTRPDVFYWSGGAWVTSGSVVGAMVVEMANRLADQSKIPVYVVVDGLSGAGISNWVGSGTSSAKYVSLKAAVEGALSSAALTSVGKTQVDAFVWMQGENDPNDYAYVANFTTLVNQLDAETWFDKTNRPVLVPRVSSNYNTSAIRGCQTEIGNMNPWIVLVDTAGAPLNGDNIHFTSAGHADIGKRLAAAYLSAPRIANGGDVRVSVANFTLAVGYSGGGLVVGSTTVGHEAGQTHTGTYTTAIGFRAARANNASYVTAIGSDALSANTGTYCVGIGAQAGQNNTGTYNVLVGNLAGQNNTGGFCVFIGRSAGAANTAASAVAIGYNAAASWVGTNYGIAIGDGAGQTITGLAPVLIGRDAGKSATANYLIAIGYRAGQWHKAADSVFIGNAAGPQTTGDGTTYNFSNVVGIGTGSQPLASNQVMLGGPTHTSVRTYATKFTTGTIPTYADDAAADADSALPSGTFYRTTSGGRTLFQKP